jgi:4'-phosphopantetheinyl transferase
VAVAVLPPPAGCSPAEAVGARDRLGLDLEPLPESEADAERLPGIETVADDRELADWKGPVTPRRLLVTWTRKEALLKASGLGLAVPLPQVRLGPPDDPPRLLARPGHQGFDGPVALADLDVDGFAGSLAILGRERIAHRVVRLPDTSTLE